ncbi:hypothetical protein [Spirosoma aerophilum]
MGGILCIMALFFYISYPDDVDQKRPLIFFFIGWTALYVFTVQQVSLLSEKERAITYLLRPASVMEKYLLIVLISGVGFVVVYLTMFTLVDAVGVSYINHRHWPSDALDWIKRVNGNLQIDPYYRSKAMTDIPATIWVLTILLHPVALAFALLLRRLTLPLVTVVIIGALVLGMVANHYFMGGLLNGERVRMSFPFADSGIIRTNVLRDLELPEPLGSQIRYSVGILAVIFLYVIGYFRLKEREV